jgi:hypothetical protein
MHPLVRGVVGSLMEHNERTKPTLALDRGRDPALVATFARSVFDAADRLDRAGDAANARSTFVYADQFFRVGGQFGPLPPEVAKLARYARWRAVELAHAAREGRPAAPPPPRGTEADFDEAELLAELEALPEPGGGAVGAGGAGGSGAGAAAFPAAAAAPAPPPPAAPAVPLGAPPAFAGAEPPPRRFAVGQRVLFCPAGTPHGGAARGAVVTGLRRATSGDGATAYALALDGGGAASARGEHLAPALAVGAPVLYFHPGGAGPEAAEVEEVYGSRWPPAYLVRAPGRGLVEAEDERVLPAPAAAAEEEAEEEEDAAVEALIAAATASAAADAAAAAPPAAPPAVPAAAAEPEPPAAEPRAAKPSAAPSAAPADAEPPAAEPSAPPPPPQAEAAPEPPPPPPPAAPPALPPKPAAKPPRKPAPAPAPAPAPTPAPTPARAEMASHPVPLPAAPDLAAIVDAQKLAKSAGSALAFDDVTTAVSMLEQALARLKTGGGGAPAAK